MKWNKKWQLKIEGRGNYSKKKKKKYMTFPIKVFWKILTHLSYNQLPLT